MTRADRLARLEQRARNTILILDGAMGTMIQRRKLGEADYRGSAFANWPSDLKGNNDLLSLTQPEVIGDIHKAFLDAGADIIETNSFNATRISQADYAMQDQARALNLAAARIARGAADAASAKTPEKPRFVAGAVGPMNKTLSVSPDVNNPGYREVDFDTVVAAYREQIEALIEGGVDLLLIETVFDTLNAKAAVYAAETVFEAADTRLPLMISGTVTDMSGRNLSGQTVEAFWVSLRHARPFSIGLNCAFGAEHLRPHAAALAAAANSRICIYPNAGLPNEMGEYDESPQATAGHLGSWAREGLLNIVGGCCGTTPDHIRAIAGAVAGLPPRTIPEARPDMQLSGLEALTLPAEVEA